MVFFFINPLLMKRGRPSACIVGARLLSHWSRQSNTIQKTADSLRLKENIPDRVSNITDFPSNREKKQSQHVWRLSLQVDV